jgi:hypothetical protein
VVLALGQAFRRTFPGFAGRDGRGRPQRGAAEILDAVAESRLDPDMWEAIREFQQRAPRTTTPTVSIPPTRMARSSDTMG